jgi:Rrf2 family iron-sulfur cluster assembly transcriptional regulator
MIKLSTKVRYATRIVVYLAGKPKGEQITAGEIARSERISVDYVEQLLSKLKAAGLVSSKRGIKGGFALACDAAGTTVADVIEAVEGSVSLIPCLTEPCENLSECVTRSVWQEANVSLTRVFKGATIGDLAAKAQQIRDSRSLTFAI